MFSQACVILFTGWVSASVHAGIPPPPKQTPPGADTPGSRHLPGADTPWGADTPQEQTPPSPDQTPPGADTPLGADTPWEQTPPRAEHAGRYGQRAGGTHPTGMQSCYLI